MKLFRSDQIKLIDLYTIKEEPVDSIDLMERAAGQLLRWYLSRFERKGRVFIFAGPGNNGGDGLALARLLKSNRYEPQVFYVEFTDKTTVDWKTNLKRLDSESKVPVTHITDPGLFPFITSEDVIIDAIFGSGLTHPVQGLAGDIIKQINNSDAIVISIDIPSGLFGEDNSANNYECIVRADFTLSFQFPKIAFMFSENSEYCGEWFILPIGLSMNAIRNTDSPYSYIEKEEISPLLKKRKKFDHKGIYGHGLLVAGSYGKMGAAVLGAKAALRAGIGLITYHLPYCGIQIAQSALPEAMALADKSEKFISKIKSLKSFNAAGIGPGLGTEPETQDAVLSFLKDWKKPVVIDADALNILSMDYGRLSLIPEGAILTPHPKEFERIAGKTDNDFQRLMRQVEFSKEHKCIVILKGANTSVTTPNGRVFFNSTGNPGMATAGSGDVLTGILLSLLAQGYASENAAILGVFIHGLAGDFAAGASGQESIIASDILENLSKAFNSIREADSLMEN
jgi:ADP-dependent NAD(P)H-hydrate dehydratase / NAD(P)H-hydrate epimerase